MKKLNNKGYMLVEIIMAFAITFALIYFLMDMVINLKNKNDDLLVDTVIKTDQTIISNKLMDYIIEDTSDEENIEFSCDKIKVNEEKNAVIYDANGDGLGGDDDSLLGIVDDSATVSYDPTDEGQCSNVNGRIHINIPVEIKQMPDKNYDIVVDYRYKLMYCNPLMSYNCANNSVGSEPYAFTYDGNCEVLPDGDDGDWKIKFLTSGTFISDCEMLIDIFLVGGGGGGGGGHYIAGGGGGGGGYTNTSVVNLKANKEYEIIIGSGGDGGKGSSSATNGENGEPTYAFGGVAFGGDGGIHTLADAGGNGGNGGSGGGGGATGKKNAGSGGSDGENGYNGSGGARYGTGQKKSTYEFGDSTLTLYSGGGGGGGGRSGDGDGSAGAGGEGGGAKGGKRKSNKYGEDALDNTGGGGGGGGAGGIDYGYAGGKGGSGIVIIRNARNIDKLELNFEYMNGSYLYVDDGNGNWRIKFLTSGTLIIKDDIRIDAFLVGGGGGGGDGNGNDGGGGGGGGNVLTVNDIELFGNNPYEIIIGDGGYGGTSKKNGETGRTTYAFTYSVLGGGGGGGDESGTDYGYKGGAGGSGGGGGGPYEGSAGNGGRNGGSGGKGTGGKGIGGGISTCEFGLGLFDNDSCNPGITMYAGGGGGGTGDDDGSNKAGYGGLGGGGNGGNGGDGSNGMVNTGGGGGGAPDGGGNGGNGGSGIVVIRNKR